MQIIPIQAVPNQTVTASLGGQQVQIDLRTMRTGLFANIFLNNAPLLYGVQCLDRVRMIRNSYFGFTGDLGFVDQQGQTDPVYTGLGTRYLLYYLEVSDIGSAIDV